VSVPVEVTPATVGALSWGVSSGFRSYITGPIAAGTVTVSAGATASGGSYRFGQSGGSFDHTTLAGDARYSGTVRFVGHGGILYLAFSVTGAP
ncbi:HtaA domain-containing protein, partial [Rhizobium johnstonii]|uniref:HtaA domain-containing protein n=1 Tax=Rhizobium johnstonii TaxID=3019933 RepID=UPI003F9A7A5E